MFKTLSLIALSLVLTGSAMAQDTGKKDTGDKTAGSDSKSSSTQAQGTKGDSGQKGAEQSPDKATDKSGKAQNTDSPEMQWGNVFTVNPNNYTSLLQLLDKQYGDRVLVTPNSYPLLYQDVAPGSPAYQYIPNIYQYPGDLSELTTQLDKPVELDLKNVPLKTALETLLRQVKLPFEFAKDVPSDIKVSLKAKGIRFQTALDAITEIAGVGWRPVPQENVPAPRPGDGPQFFSGLKVQIQITKDRQRGLLWFNGPIRNERFYDDLKRWNDQAPNGSNGWYQFFFAPDKNTWNLQIAPPNKNSSNQNLPSLPSQQNSPQHLFTAPNALQKFQDSPLLTVPNQLDKSTPQKQQALPNNLANTLSALGVGANPFLYDATKTEIRSVFTCPHCHEQITVVRKHVSLKCPTCGRTFQDDWKFCPFDGAKRPAEPESWKFCPHCGKPVS